MAPRYKYSLTEVVGQGVKPGPYFDSTGICLLIDSSREMRVSVRITPGIA